MLSLSVSLSPQPLHPKPSSFSPKTQQKRDIFLRKQNPQIDPLDLTKNRSLSIPTSEDHRLKLLELSLVRKRPPQFPGSIQNDTVRALDETLFGDDVAMLVKAVEIRRSVAAEIVKEAMTRKGRFGITYCENMVRLLGGFVDYVMIRAVEMKGVKGYEGMRFNDRVKEFVDQSNVVPLIRAVEMKGVKGYEGMRFNDRVKEFVDRSNVVPLIRAVEMKGVKGYEGMGFNDRVKEFVDQSNVVPLIRFVDYAMIRAVEMKGCEGMEFNDRVKEFVDRSNVVPFIRAVEMKGVEGYEGMGFNDRVKEFVDQSSVVSLIRWLKHNSLSYPQIAKLICMSRGNLEAIWEIAEWIKSIGVKGRFIGVAFMKVGEKILNKSIEELDEIVDFLETNGVRRDWMGYVISRCPHLLACTMDEIESRVRFYKNMGMNTNDFGTMVFDYPHVLGSFSMEEMNQKVAYLMEFGLDNEQVGRLLAFKPQLMGCSIEERWKPLVKYLYYLGVPKDGMRRILTIKPIVFCVDLETTIVPKVQFLRDIGVREDALGNMLAKFPPIFTYSLYKKIRPVVIFLLTKAGVTQKNIGKVIGLAPELLGCSIAHKLDGNVKYFLSLGISLRVLGEMISDFPMLLRYNTDVLRPKYRYLRRTMVRPLEDVIEFPRFFSYSLEGRIAPRHKILVENRVNFKLRYILAGTDEEFSNRVNAAVERRRRFEAGIIDEYSSDSQTTSFIDENLDDSDVNYTSCYSDATTATDECSDFESL